VQRRREVPAARGRPGDRRPLHGIAGEGRRHDGERAEDRDDEEPSPGQGSTICNPDSPRWGWLDDSIHGENVSRVTYVAIVPGPIADLCVRSLSPHARAEEQGFDLHRPGLLLPWR
jgi:hypothetical protein